MPVYNVSNGPICFSMTFIKLCTINLCCYEDQMSFLPYLVSQDFAGEEEETGVATGNRRHT